MAVPTSSLMSMCLLEASVTISVGRVSTEVNGVATGTLKRIAKDADTISTGPAEREKGLLLTTTTTGIPIRLACIGILSRLLDPLAHDNGVEVLTEEALQVESVRSV